MVLKRNFQVILGDLTSTGSGSSKKQAKHAAARAMLDKLDGRVPAQDGQTPLPPVADTANGPQAPGGTHIIKRHPHQSLTLYLFQETLLGLCRSCA